MEKCDKSPVTNCSFRVNAKEIQVAAQCVRDSGEERRDDALVRNGTE